MEEAMMNRWSFKKLRDAYSELGFFHVRANNAQQKF